MLAGTSCWATQKIQQNCNVCFYLKHHTTATKRQYYHTSHAHCSMRRCSWISPCFDDWPPADKSGGFSRRRTFEASSPLPPPPPNPPHETLKTLTGGRGFAILFLRVIEHTCTIMYAISSSTYYKAPILIAVVQCTGWWGAEACTDTAPFQHHRSPEAK